MAVLALAIHQGYLLDLAYQHKIEAGTECQYQPQISKTFFLLAFPIPPQAYSPQKKYQIT